MIRPLFILTFLLFSTFAHSANYTWQVNGTGTSYSTPTSACSAAASQAWGGVGAVVKSVTVSGEIAECVIRWEAQSVETTVYIYRSGDTCPANTFFNPANGQCEANPCTAKTGQTSFFEKTYESYEAYKTLPEVFSQGGCAFDTSGHSDMQCATNGQTGQFVCSGTGVYTGEQLAPVEDGSLTSTEEPVLKPLPPPVVTNSGQICTQTGTTTVTCVTESSSTEYASSQCSVGSTGGSTGLVCVKPDYVPQHAGKEQTVVTTTTQNPDGSTTTSTTTTTNNTHCAAGACTTTTTTQTGTKTTDANGNTTGETATCEGANCEKPKDETKPGKLPTSHKPEAFTVDTELEEQDSFSESTQAFYSRIAQAPLVSALNNIQVPSGGACSIGSASLFGGSISFNHFCEIAPNILSGLTYLFLAIWAWAAIRLFFTA